MSFWRFDDKAILLAVVRELVDHGVSREQIDVKLSEIGPVDLDLLRECFDEIAAEHGRHETLAA